MRCNFRKIIEHARNMMNFALMLTANRDDVPGFDARHNAESFGQSGKVL